MSKASVVATQMPVKAEKLPALIERYISNQGWLFLQWPHKVSMVPIKGSKNFECREGQAFDQSCELRWKYIGKDQYDVLLLADTELSAKALSLEGVSLCSIGDGWTAQAVNAQAHSKTETRFPRGVDMPDSLNLEQRYFIDTKTACVQFIALKVK